MRSLFLLWWLLLFCGCASGSGEGRTPARAPGGRSSESEIGAAALEAKAVVATVQSLFDALEDRDVAAASSLLATDARFVAVDDDGIHPSTRESFLEELPTMTSVEERMWEPEVRIDGNLATLWAPYELSKQGVLAHCGYDAIQLVRSEGRWQVLGIVFTSRQNPCPSQGR